MAYTVVGMFDTPQSAQRAMDELTRQGIDRSSIRMADANTDWSQYGINQNHSNLYSGGMKRGGSVLLIQAPDQQKCELYQSHLERAGAIDVDEMSTHLQSAPQDSTLQVLREQLNVGKKQVERGGVRIHSYVTEQPVQEQVTLREEHVDVQRRPVNEKVSPSALDSFQERTVEVRETAEVPVVAKEARVVEEIEIGKHAEQRTETISDKVRETHVDVDQIGQQFDEAYYRNDFQTRFGSTAGAQWDTYRPAYEYGHQMRGRMQGGDWNSSETQIRQNWETRNPGTWDRYRDAIRSSFEGHRTGEHGRAYADNPQDTRGWMEKAADTVTGDKIDDKTGRRID